VAINSVLITGIVIQQYRKSLPLPDWRGNVPMAGVSASDASWTKVVGAGVAGAALGAVATAWLRSSPAPTTRVIPESAVSLPHAANRPTVLTVHLLQGDGLLELASRVNEANDLRTAATEILDAALEAVQAERATLFLVETQGSTNSLAVVLTRGNDQAHHKDILKRLTIPVNDKSIAGSVALTGVGEVIADTYSDSRFNKSVDKETGFVTKTMVCVPLLGRIDASGRPEVIGAIQTLNRRDGASFEAHHLTILERFAGVTGSLVQRLRLVLALQDAQTRTNELLQLMREIPAEANMASTHGVVKAIIRTAYRMLECERVAVFLVDRATGDLVIQESADAAGLRIPRGQGIVGRVASGGMLLNIPDAKSDSRFSASVDRRTGFQTRSVLAAPIRGHTGAVEGVLMAINRVVDGSDLASVSRTSTRTIEAASPESPSPPARSPRRPPHRRLASDSSTEYQFFPFTESDEVVMEALVGQAGVELGRATAAKELQHSRDTTQCLLEVVHASATESSLGGLVSRVISSAFRLLQAERVSLFLVDPVRYELLLVNSPDARGARIPIGTGIVGNVAKTGVSMNIPNAYECPLFNASIDTETGFHTRSVLAVPVSLPTASSLAPAKGGGSPTNLFDSAPIAVLQAINKREGGVFDESDEEAMRVFCIEVAVALKRRSVEAALLTMLSEQQERSELDTVDDAEIHAFSSSQDVETSGGRSRRATIATVPTGSSKRASRTSTTDSRTSTVSDARRGPSEREVAVSLLSYYNDEHVNSRLHASVLLRRVSITEKKRSWPEGLMATASSVSDRSDPLFSWSWDIFALWGKGDEEGEANLLGTVVAILREFALLRRYDVPEQVVRLFVRKVRDKYHENPFHNWRHAVAVMQATFLILLKTSAHQMLPYEEVYAVLVAALCHDIDHPGYSNAYLIATSSPLALEHNDDAPLERHHSATIATLLREERLDIFKTLTPPDRLRVRKVMVSSILATDMSRHMGQVQALSDRAAKFSSRRVQEAEGGGSHHQLIGKDRSFSSRDGAELLPSAQYGALARSASAQSSDDTEAFAFDRDDPAERLTLMECMVHTADLSGQAFPAHVAHKWGAGIIAEFRNEATAYVREGLSPPPFIADLSTELAQANLQLGFVGRMVYPLWERMNDVLPGLGDPVRNLQANLLVYEENVKRLEEAHAEE
jgi:GAF domain-containing protein